MYPELENVAFANGFYDSVRGYKVNLHFAGRDEYYNGFEEGQKVRDDTQAKAATEYRNIAIAAEYRYSGFSDAVAGCYEIDYEHYEAYNEGHAEGTVAREKLIKQTNKLNKGYSERNMFIRFLSHVYPSHLAIPTDADPGWSKIVCVHTPAGQMTWHIADDELVLFKHVGELENDWDEHTTDQKYARLEYLGWMLHDRYKKDDRYYSLLKSLFSYIYTNWIQAMDDQYQESTGSEYYDILRREYIEGRFDIIWGVMTTLRRQPDIFALLLDEFPKLEAIRNNLENQLRHKEGLR